MSPAAERLPAKHCRQVLSTYRRQLFSNILRVLALQHRVPKSSTALDLALIASSQLHEAGTARTIHAAMIEHGQSVGKVATGSTVAAICWGEGPEVGSVAALKGFTKHHNHLQPWFDIAIQSGSQDACNIASIVKDSSDLRHFYSIHVQNHSF